MKRWNGWGNTSTHYPVPETAIAYLKDRLGDLPSIQDASLESVLASVPASRLPFHPLIDTDPETRLRHSRGQSLPDWVALSHNRIESFTDGVAFPRGPADIRELFEYSQKNGVRIIPYGGGTSVVGHINPLPGVSPVLTISLEKMDQLLSIDKTSQLAEFEAGVAGPALEEQLQKSGYTLGHFPQSFEYSTLGGWIASRSSGQQSYHYGRIEDLFAGGEVETPRGKLEILPYPASAAGPDLKEVILGSEGRAGIITRAKVRIRPLPEKEGFYGIFFPTWQSGSAAVRQIAQADLGVSMLRLSNEIETETTLILSGKSWIGLADRGLRLAGYGNQRCLLIFGVTGSSRAVRSARQAVIRICRKLGGLFVGAVVGHTWEKSRFTSPYLRNTLWQKGVAVDTLETALPWEQVREASRAIPEAITLAAKNMGEEVLVMTHLSHIYQDGASIYTTYLFRRSADPEKLLERWTEMKGSASRTIQQFKGTISHQHGVGTDHKSYLKSEKGELGLDILDSFFKTVDPAGLCNPGKLID